MSREWYLIDDEGIHPLNINDESADFWGNFGHEGDEDPWPEFNQLVVNAPPTEVVDAVCATATKLQVDVEPVTDDPERWDGGLVVAETDGPTVVGEPNVDVDERVMARRWSEVLVDHLGCDGAFFGFDAAARTLHLVEFHDGDVDFAWADSLSPGPSYAMIFEDGVATDEDPRRFALRMLGLPETSPFLDRYQFVISRLEQLGVESVSPELGDLPVTAVLAVRHRADVAHGT